MLNCRIAVAPPEMSGKPCASCTSGTETWAPLMNSWVYLAKRRNPSVILGCWLPVETWHCSQALKRIKKKCQRKEGNAGTERGDRKYREVRFIVSAERGEKEKATKLESDVHWPAVCSVGGWYPNVPGGGDFGTFCLSCDDCWEAATLAFREVQRVFVGLVGSLYNYFRMHDFGKRPHLWTYRLTLLCADSWLHRAANQFRFSFLLLFFGF